ncbi:hypothetical protein [Leptodesmis sp.]|uniref:hypothetical protein n=1 Tax=Leptodesmis sp. TaxID=3100501 RepID=UPI0040534C78
MAMQIGFIDYICKPYDVETLEAAIGKCLAHSLPMAPNEVTAVTVISSPSVL